ncbi:MAG: ADOP family duplicated permease [Terriglobia bacterium]
MFDWIKVLASRIHGLLARRELGQEFQQELDAHLEMLTEENIRQGVPPEEARRAARLRLGNSIQLREAHRERWGLPWLETFFQDVRYGLRQLRRNPGFTLVAVFTLALGIGANTAIFTVVNAILLEPLPYVNPGRLVYIWEFWPHERTVRAVPTPDFTNWQAHNGVFQALAAYGGDRSADLTSNGEPEPVEDINVSAEFFSVLGIQPFLGRTFDAQEEQPGGNSVVLLGHAIWQQRFGSDPKILGRSITLDGQEYTVVGVLPAGFRFPDNQYNPQLFFPDINATAANWHSPQYLALQWIIGRLRPGITQGQAHAQLMMLTQRTASQEPIQFARMRTGMEIHMIPLHGRLSGSARPILLVLFGAVGLVLLVACVNVACLELARATTRQKEIAVRTALGAGRSRMLRQLVTEGVLLALLGGMAALVVGFWGVRLLRVLGPQGIPHIESIGMDGIVFAFTLVVAVVTGILFGLVPAFASSKVDLLETLKEGSTSGTAMGARRRARGALIVSEIALAGVLLAGAGLLARTFINLINVDPGCRTDHVLTLRIALPRSRYSKSAQQVAFFERLLGRVRALPGVQSAAVGTGIPTACCGYILGTAVEGKPLPPPGSRPDVPFDWASLGYFRTLGIPLIAGRNFNELDGQSSPNVAVVNQAFARRFFPRQNAVGKHVYTGSWREVIGIVGDVRQDGPLHPARSEIYGPLAQDSNGEDKMILVIHTLNDPRALIPEIRRIVGTIDKSLPVYDVATMEERLSKSISSERFNMLLVTILAALALVLVSVGIYGVTSYSVAQRTREIGIRMAVGAQRSDVLRMVIGQGLKLALMGMAMGVVGAFGLTRFLSSLLYGVKATDLLTFVAVSLILTGVALLACYFPARRAAKVDPMVALRYE